MIKTKDKKGNIRQIFLDGVHRVVAAKFRRSKIKILVINV